MPIRRLSGTEAYAALKANPYSEWPRRDDPDNRFAHYADPAFSPRFRLEPGQKIFTIGSCFARNIERDLQRAGFDVPTLGLTLDMPQWTGTAVDALNNYVPQTIAPQIRWAFDLEQFDFDKHCVELRPGRFLDLQIPFVFKPMPEAVVRDNRSRISAIYRHLATSHAVLITLGLIEAWYDHHAQSYITCPPPKGIVRSDPKRFELHVLEYNEVLAAMRDLLVLLDSLCPGDYHVILTVSPVPLHSTFTTGDVAVANAYSKAVLRAVAEAVVAERANVQYFPSYESVTLTDRSLAYVADQVHVEGGLVRLNVDRMMRSYVEPATAETAAAIVARAREERSSGRSGVALKTLQAGWKKFPDDADLVVELAASFGRAGRPDAMERLLLQFLDGRDDPRARLQLATHYNNAGRHEEAVHQTEHGLLLKKGRLGLAIQHARACHHLERWQEGLAVLADLGHAWDLNGDILFWKARCHEGLQNFAEAEACYRRCLDSKEDAPYMTTFAEFLIARGKTDEAREWVGKALDVSPLNPQALKLKLALFAAPGRPLADASGPIELIRAKTRSLLKRLRPS
jgi:hypothetical protein